MCFNLYKSGPMPLLEILKNSIYVSLVCKSGSLKRMRAQVKKTDSVEASDLNTTLYDPRFMRN